jgi:YidC/Oxa1 family membrane protein insertase
MGLPTAQVSSGWASPVDLAADLAPRGDEHSKSYAPKKISKLTADDLGRLAAADYRWGGVHTKYFVQYLAAVDFGFRGATLAAPLSADEKEQQVSATLFLPAVSLEPGAERSFRLTAYAGPKDYQRLHDLGGRVDSILQMDLFFFWHPEWMGAVARVILKGLIWTYDSIGKPWAYGLAIVIITFLVKLLFWPLTHYSTLSMKKMQTVQPRIVEIREKYKDDPAKVQQKIMELYREEKVNPMGGCLPIVLQIPVFFALFNVFRGAIELRHASFLWVADLSQPDTLPWLLFGLPIRPLAILMAVTMFLQQKLTPSSLDPMQAKMMTIMTLFFAFIFYGMPAGLTLYWTVNQVLSIVQTLITYRLVKQMTPVHPKPA